MLGWWVLGPSPKGKEEKLLYGPPKLCLKEETNRKRRGNLWSHPWLFLSRINIKVVYNPLLIDKKTIVSDK